MADRTRLYTKTQLRDQLRRKPGPGQAPASRYWQGHTHVDLHDTAEAVALRPRRASTPAQAAALAASRAQSGRCPAPVGGATRAPSCCNTRSAAPVMQPPCGSSS